MPWRDTSPMDQRLQFVAEYTRQLWSMTELCARYGISRKTGYKWVHRYATTGAAGLEERSRRPAHSPGRTPDALEAAVLTVKHRHPQWGAKKLVAVLAAAAPEQPWPSVVTVHRILQRHGLVGIRRRQRQRAHPGRPQTVSAAPNAIWTADFKGEFKTGDGQYCYPLTIIDDYSRYLLACRALAHPTRVATQATFRHLFRTVGLPQVIRTDNGTPFASTGVARLSRLAVWWIRLGIRPELIEPARPAQNGRHERLHRTLKAATAHPPAASRQAQQQRFHRFRHEYNEVRPHEALGQCPPASRYTPSAHAWPAVVPVWTYPDHYERRRVSNNGCLKWHRRNVFVSSVLRGEEVGLAPIVPGAWDVYYGPHRLGVFLEVEGHIDDARPRKT